MPTVTDPISKQDVDVSLDSTYDQLLNEQPSSSGFSLDVDRFNYDRNALTGDAVLHRDQQAAATEAYNRQYNEYMENTKYQRMMQDLAKSGINPLYAVLGGNSATGGSYSSGQKGGSSTGLFSALIVGLLKIMAAAAAAGA